MDDAVRQALATDLVVDITTTGRHSGTPQRKEIWLHAADGRYYITGTPGPRGWLANLKAEPAFTVHLKQSVPADLPARAAAIEDAAARAEVLSLDNFSWYREQAPLDELVAHSPLVEVWFDDHS